MNLRIIVVSGFCFVRAISAEPFDIGSGSFIIPEGWSHLAAEGHAMTPRRGAFKNEEGDIYIMYTYDYAWSHDRAELFKLWKPIKEGSVRGFDYIVYSSRKSDSERLIVFPDINTYFQPLFLQDPNDSLEEAIQWNRILKGNPLEVSFESTLNLILEHFLPQSN